MNNKRAAAAEAGGRPKRGGSGSGQGSQPSVAAQLARELIGMPVLTDFFGILHAGEVVAALPPDPGEEPATFRAAAGIAGQGQEAQAEAVSPARRSRLRNNELDALVMSPVAQAEAVSPARNNELDALVMSPSILAGARSHGSRGRTMLPPQTPPALQAGGGSCSSPPRTAPTGAAAAASIASWGDWSWSVRYADGDEMDLDFGELELAIGLHCSEMAARRAKRVQAVPPRVSRARHAAPRPSRAGHAVPSRAGHAVPSRAGLTTAQNNEVIRRCRTLPRWEPDGNQADGEESGNEEAGGEGGAGGDEECAYAHMRQLAQHSIAWGLTAFYARSGLLQQHEGDGPTGDPWNLCGIGTEQGRTRLPDDSDTDCSSPSCTDTNCADTDDDSTDDDDCAPPVRRCCAAAAQKLEADAAKKLKAAAAEKLKPQSSESASDSDDVMLPALLADDSDTDTDAAPSDTDSDTGKVSVDPLRRKFPCAIFDKPRAGVLDAAVLAFQKAIGEDRPAGPCAGCGAVVLDELGAPARNPLPIAELDHLRLGVGQTAKWQQLSPIGRSAWHAVEEPPGSGIVYGLLPHSSREDGRFMVCHACAKAPAKTKFTASDFVNFRLFDPGRPLRLPGATALTRFQKMALSRYLVYACTVKVRDRGGNEYSSKSNKKHAFTVLHDGAKKIAGHLVLNSDVVRAFSIVFIGSGARFVQCRSGGFDGLLGVVDAAAAGRCLDTLAYFKHAGHPLYQECALPAHNNGGVAGFAKDLQELATAVGSAAEHNETAVALHAERVLECTEDGASAIVRSAAAAPTAEEEVAALEQFVADSEAAADPATAADAAARRTAEGEARGGATVEAEAGGLSNEYEDMHEIIGGAFAHLFPRGCPEQLSSGHFPAAVTARLLRFYLPLFEEDSELLLLMFNMVQRHAASRVVAKRAKAGTLDKLRTLLQAEDFDERLLQASLDPNCADARQLLNKVRPLLRSSGALVPWSPLEREREMAHMYSMAQRFGPHDLFITFAQGSASQPMAVRFGLRCDGWRLHDAREAEWGSDLSDTGAAFDGGAVTGQALQDLRARAAREHPATCADHFNRVTMACMQHLFGAAPVGVPGGRRSEVFTGAGDEDSKPGLFGRCRAMHAVVEAQARGALHLHAIVWTEHGPLSAARFVHCKRCRKRMAKVVDAAVSGRLGPLQKEAAREKQERAAAKAAAAAAADAAAAAPAAAAGVASASEEVPAASFQPMLYDQLQLPLNGADARASGLKCAARTNVHTHGPRCHKPPIGLHKCALCMKRRPQPGHSAWKQLQLVNPPAADDEARGRSARAAERTAEPMRRIAAPPTAAGRRAQPLQQADNRVIALVLRRDGGSGSIEPHSDDKAVLPHDDQRVSEYSEALSGCLQCNTCITKVGCAVDARAQLHYNVKYCAKNSAELAESLSLVLTARAAALRYGSTADDAGTPLRDTQFLLSRVLNSATCVEEYSTEQAAAALLGHPSSYSTARYSLCYVRPAAACLRAQWQRGGGVAAGEPEPESGLDSDLESGLDDPGADGDFATLVNDTAEDSSAALDCSGGNVDSHRDPESGAVTFSLQHDDYRLRSEALSMLNLYEFTALIERHDVVAKEGGSRGRQPAFTAPLQAEHPKSAGGSHLRLRALHSTPVLAGAPRPTYREWKKKGKPRAAFVLYYVTLLVPWGSGSVSQPGARPAEYWLEPGTGGRFLRFTRLMRRWKRSRSAALRARHRLFHNIVHNMSAPYEGRVASMKYRGEYADVWRDLDPKDAGYGGSSSGRPAVDPLVVQATDEALQQLRQDADARSGLVSHDAHRREYILEQRQVQAALLGGGAVTSAGGAGAPAPAATRGEASYDTFADYGALWRQSAAVTDLSTAPDVAAVPDAPANAGVWAATQAGRDAKDALDQYDLNAQQLVALESFAQPVLAGQQTLMLLVGGPGTGKTHTLTALEQHLRAQGSGSTAAAFMWSAVAQLNVACRRQSVHGLLHCCPAELTPKAIQTGSFASAAKAAKVRAELGDKTRVLILDEISCVDLQLFDALDVMLRAAFPERHDKPFGGMSVVATGDFGQLPPEPGTNAAHALAAISASPQAYGGGDAYSLLAGDAALLLMKFRRVILTENMRAAADPVHVQRLERFSLAAEAPPVTEAMLGELQQLTPELLQADPEFRSAGIAVQSNEERHALAPAQIVAWARAHGQVVFRWTLPMAQTRGQRCVESGKAWVELGAHELEVLWARGLPMVFTGRVGSVHSTRAATGTACEAHSFCHETEDLGGTPFVMPDVTGHAAGDIIDIPFPRHLNVLVRGRGGQEDFIVPITATTESKPFEAYLKHAPAATRKRLGSLKTAPKVYTHRVEQALVFTYNKLQGATVARVVLVVNCLSMMRLGNMSHAKLYVALSRVREGAHLAIWPCDLKNMKYLCKLRPSPQMVAWNRHYDEGGRWKCTTPAVLPGVFTKPDLLRDVEDLKKGAAVAACRRLSVFIGKKSVGELIDLLRDPFLRAKARQ
jgi:hypothetical protein